MSLSNMLSENKSNWEPTVLRLTAFPSPSAQFDEQEWWRELVGEPPETQNMQPRTREKVEVGGYKNANLLLGTHPTRIDWQYRINDTLLGVGKLPTLGIFQQAIDEFVGLMGRWLGNERIPNLARLAFGAELIQPVDTREEAYLLLTEYSHLNANLENASDFLYQINRPRDSEIIPSLLLNRLSKWSAMRTQERIFQPIQQVTDLYAARLELDINTTVEFDGVLPRSELTALFQELVELGEQISIEGDIP